MKWLEGLEFTWELGTATSFAALYAQFSTADLIAVDIEVIKEPLAITTVAYTGVWLTGSIPKLHSFVIELNNDYNLSWVADSIHFLLLRYFKTGSTIAHIYYAIMQFLVIGC